MYLAINEIIKKPTLLTKSDEIVYIKDMRRDELRSIVIPSKYYDLLKDKINEIEYLLFKQRNEKALADTFELDGVLGDVGDKND